MKNRFDITEKEAKEKFNKYKNLDPFPNIRPALLNSADILDYVAETGIIFPFHEAKLKSASYEIALLGQVILWDGNGEKISKDLKEEEEFFLPQNSIAFVTPEPTFRIPDYIALRFNLKITHVHRGLLLGTGPLIDPGYEGKLLIPLHNLTNNKYRFKGGEGLIWVEFTKISENKRWMHELKDHEELRRIGEYRTFPEEKKNRQPEYFIANALKGQNCDSIPSSIPIALNRAENSAKASREDANVAKKAAEKLKNYGFLAMLALIITLAAIVIAVFSLVSDINHSMRNLQDGIHQKVTAQGNELIKAEQEIQSLKVELQNVKQELQKKSTSLAK